MPAPTDHVRKSIGAENTLQRHYSLTTSRDVVQPNIAKVWRCREATRIRGRTVTWKEVFWPSIQTRSRSNNNMAPSSSHLNSFRPTMKPLISAIARSCSGVSSRPICIAASSASLSLGAPAPARP